MVFADNTLASEKEFHGTIAGAYKITGRVDRLASIDGNTDIVDFKYSKRQGKYEIPTRTTVRERFQEKGILHPAAQLIIYQHFNEAQAARFYFIKEPTQDRQIQLPEKESKEAKELMLAIKERLDKIIGSDEIIPAHDCGECEYCQYQALCGKEDYYKAARRGS